MDRDFADTFVSFARGKIGRDEMNKAFDRLSRDVVRTYTTKDIRETEVKSSSETESKNNRK